MLAQHLSTATKHCYKQRTNQSTAGHLTATRYARDQLRCDVNVELGAWEAVEKEQRLRSMAEYVIGRHCNQVYADWIIPLNGTCYLHVLKQNADTLGFCLINPFFPQSPRLRPVVKKSSPSPSPSPPPPPSSSLSSFNIKLTKRNLYNKKIVKNDKFSQYQYEQSIWMFVEHSDDKVAAVQFASFGN